MGGREGEREIGEGNNDLRVPTEPPRQLSWAGQIKGKGVSPLVTQHTYIHILLHALWKLLVHTHVYVCTHVHV